MNAERTLTTKRNRCLTVMLALCLALTMLLSQDWYGQVLNLAPAVAYACQGPGGSC